jgi:hypothetical protein
MAAMTWSAIQAVCMRFWDTGEMRRVGRTGNGGPTVAGMCRRNTSPGLPAWRNDRTKAHIFCQPLSHEKKDHYANGLSLRPVIHAVRESLVWPGIPRGVGGSPIINNGLFVELRVNRLSGKTKDLVGAGAYPASSQFT